MRNRFLVGIATVMLCSHLLNVASAAVPPLEDVLDKFSSALKRPQLCQTSSTDFTTISDSSEKTRWTRLESKYASDKDRINLEMKIWDPASADAQCSDNNAEIRKYCWDGKLWYEFYQPVGFPDARYIVIRKDGPHREIVDIAQMGTSLDGRVDGDSDSLDIVLKRAHCVLRSKTELVNGVNCFVVDAKGPDGTYTVWIDPEHGFLVSKASVLKGKDDTFFGRMLGDLQNDHRGSEFRFDKYSFELRISKFVQVGEKWIGQSEVVDRVTNYVGGRINSQHQVHTRTSMGESVPSIVSLSPHFPDGTRVTTIDYNGPLRWRWFSGKAVPVADDNVKSQVDQSVKSLGRD